MPKLITALAFVLVVAVADTASAAAPRADLEVTLQAPASISINTPTVYTAKIKNRGPNTAEGVNLTVTLPLTNTSPTTAILGTVSGLDSRCSVVNKRIVCAQLGSLKKDKTITINYTYTAPVANKPLTMTAVGAATTADPVAGNNTASVTPSFVYPNRPIVSASILNSHCTGQNLSAYFECLLFPSSIATHGITLNADHTITFVQQGSGYTGTWSQPTPYQLTFSYFEGADKVMEFNGFATNGNTCFDGITNFFPASNYMSAYRACIQ